MFSIEFSLIVLHYSILWIRCTGTVQDIWRINSQLVNNYAEVYFFKVKVLLAKKVRKMNLFLNPFFAQRRLYLIQFWLAEHPWRTAAQSFAYAHVESNNRYVCAALKVWRLTSFAMNIDSFIIQLRCTIHSLMVNAFGIVSFRSPSAIGGPCKVGPILNLG